MIISCGFLIESSGKVLLCHATNGKQKPSLKGNRYGIPKGKQDSGEYYIDTALRELKEETDLDLLDTTRFKVSSNHMSVKYKKIAKTLKVFKVVDSTGELLKFPFKCNTYFEWKGLTIPEVDSYLWLDYDTAKDVCIKGQIPIFEPFDWLF